MYYIFKFKFLYKNEINKYLKKNSLKKEIDTTIHENKC